MSTRRRVVGFAFGKGMAQVAVALRGILIARIVGPENMGIAATFMAVVSFVEMFSTTGSDRFILQDPEGAEPKSIRTLQLVALLRGIALAAALAVLAIPVSRVFETETAIAGYFVLLLVPLFRGMQNLDWAVQQRALRPKTSVLMPVFAEYSSLAVGVAVALWTRNWWASVASMTVQALVLALVSHVRAERRWEFGYNRELARRAFRFATPLLLSGFLLFLALQGDRLAVSVADTLRGAPTYQLADLGRYAVAGTIAMLPVALCADLAYGVFLPWLMKAGSDGDASRRRRDIVVFYGVLSLSLVLGQSTVGGEILRILFGEKYGDLGMLLTLLGLAQSIRIMRVTANVAAMSRGDTTNILVGSIGRTSGVALAVFAACIGTPLEWIALAAVVGEVLAFAGCELALRMRHASVGGGFPVAAIVVCVLVAAAAVGRASVAAIGPWLGLLAALGGLALLGLTAWLASAAFRAEARGILTLLRRGRARAA